MGSAKFRCLAYRRVMCPDKKLAFAALKQKEYNLIRAILLRGLSNPTIINTLCDTMPHETLLALQ